MKILNATVLSLFLILYGSICFSSESLATTGIPFYDDFEDGDHDGWGAATTGGIGGTGVEERNDSFMATVWHSGKFMHALVNDFYYNPDYEISFDMEAIALTHPGVFRTLHSYSGVKFSFLNTFNSPLGNAGLIRATTSSLLGANDLPIDQFPHDYNFTMGEVASLAGLTSSDPIEKFSMSFVTYGEFSAENNGRSNSQVWFDNVMVTPEPISTLLFLFGGGTMFMFGRGKKKI